MKGPKSDIEVTALIRQIEDDGEDDSGGDSDGDRLREILDALPLPEKRAHLIGVTGPAGVGKSSLISALTREFLCLNKKIAILCIDPSGPLTGGAFLGDRIRMKEHYLNKDVFIRSLAGRGAKGALCPHLLDIIRLVESTMDKDIIIVETIGAGQDQVDIKAVVDFTLLVLSPGIGDEIQTLKSGLLEIPDICVVNKKDQEGAEVLAQELACFGQKMVMLTNCLSNEGIKELAEKILSLPPSQTQEQRFIKALKLRLKEKIQREVEKMIEMRIEENIRLHKSEYDQNPYLFYQNMIKKFVTIQV